MLLFISQLQKYSKIETMSSKTSALHKSPIESHSLPNVLGYWIYLENAYVTTITSGSAIVSEWFFVSVCGLYLLVCMLMTLQWMPLFFCVANSSRQQPLSLKCTHWYFVPLSKHTIGHGKIYFGKDSSMFYTCIINIW